MEGNFLSHVLCFLSNIDWSTIIVGALVPVLIMIFTLRSEKKMQNASLAQQAKEHQQQLQQQENEHETEMNEQNKSIRLSVLPIFKLVEMSASMEHMPYLSEESPAKHIFSLILENVGNGMAISPFIKSMDTSETNLNHLIDSTESSYYCCYKDIPYSNMIVSQREKVEVKIIREPKQEISPNLELFILPIKFSDVLGNWYEQRIAVQFFISENGNITITTIHAIAPELSENYTDAYNSQRIED